RSSPGIGAQTFHQHFSTRIGRYCTCDPDDPGGCIPGVHVGPALSWEPGKERISCKYESRDSHSVERHHWNDRTYPRDRTHFGTTRLSEDGEVVRGLIAARD